MGLWKKWKEDTHRFRNRSPFTLTHLDPLGKFVGNSYYSEDGTLHGQMISNDSKYGRSSPPWGLGDTDLRAQAVALPKGVVVDMLTGRVASAKASISTLLMLINMDATRHLSRRLTRPVSDLEALKTRLQQLKGLTPTISEDYSRATFPTVDGQDFSEVLLENLDKKGSRWIFKN